MVNTIYLNFGLSERLLNYIRTTYPTSNIVERGNTYVIIDVSAMTTSDQNLMRNDINQRLVEQI
jgi:hypothetical protein